MAGIIENLVGNGADAWPVRKVYILELLCKAGKKGMTQPELKEITGFSQSAVSRLCDSLELETEDGERLIGRMQDAEAMCNTKRMYVTDAGKRFYNKVK